MVHPGWRSRGPVTLGSDCWFVSYQKRICENPYKFSSVSLTVSANHIRKNLICSSSHRRGILSILGLQDSPSISKKDVQYALSSWDSVEFETIAAERNMCATALRSFAEWDSVPQALSLRNTLPVMLIRFGDAPRRAPDERFTRPLEGIRVLELTRVIAGPVAGRTLAGKDSLH